MKFVFIALAVICSLLGAYQIYIQNYLSSPAGISAQEVSPNHMENIRPVFTPPDSARSSAEK